MKANWHIDVDVDESDPFAAPQLEEVDLRDPNLNERLAELLKREGGLYQRGITCELKDRPDSCCSACPLRGGSKVHPIRELCKVGTEQERTVMSMIAAQ